MTSTITSTRVSSLGTESPTSSQTLSGTHSVTASERSQSRDTTISSSLSLLSRSSTNGVTQSRSGSRSVESRSPSARGTSSISYSRSISGSLSGPLTNTLPIPLTHTTTFPLPLPPLPDTYFSFSQTETIVFSVLAFIVALSWSLSLRLCFKRAKKVLRRRAARKARDASIAGAHRRHPTQFEMDGGINPEEDVAFAEFVDDALHHDEAVNYLYPTHAAGHNGEVHDLDKKLRKHHSVFGVPHERAVAEVTKRIQNSDPRLERLERSFFLRRQETRLAMDGTSDNEQMLRARVSGLELMHATAQVPPVELDELPWLTPDEVSSIKNAELLDRRTMLVQSGRDTKSVASERRTLEVLGSIEKPNEVSPNADAGRRSTVSLAMSSRPKPAGFQGDAGVTESDMASVLRAKPATLSDRSSYKSSASFRGNSSFYRRMQQAAESEVMSTSSAGQSAGQGASTQAGGGTLLTWDDVHHRSGNAELYQFSASPLERLRNVRKRVDIGPFGESMDGFGGSDDEDGKVFSPRSAPVVTRSVDILPDPDEETFAGIDLNYRLLDADL